LAQPAAPKVANAAPKAANARPGFFSGFRKLFTRKNPSPTESFGSLIAGKGENNRAPLLSAAALANAST
jgi:hypothetical protein